MGLLPPFRARTSMYSGVGLPRSSRLSLLYVQSRSVIALLRKLRTEDNCQDSRADRTGQDRTGQDGPVGSDLAAVLIVDWLGEDGSHG